MTKVVWLDIDGTIADVEHRRHYIRNGKKDWDAFFEDMINDPPIESIVDLVTSIDIHSTPIYCCTGRPEKYRKVTEDWLRRHYIYYTKLYMRKDNDTRTDHVIKLEMLNTIRQNGDEVLVAIEDRSSVVSMLRQNGVTVLQCSDFDESKAQAGVRLDILIGPSGAGKSLYCSDQIDNGMYTNDMIISSDTLRYELCGDFKDQSHNDDVFAAMHAIARTRLAHGLNVVLDATHIKTKDRLAAASLGTNCTVNYIIINRPLPAKILDGGWRNSVVLANGKTLIEAHENTFNSNLNVILNGDELPNVKIRDLRKV